MYIVRWLKLLQSLQSLLCEKSTEIIIVDVHAWVEGSDGCKGWSVAYRGRLFGVKIMENQIYQTYFNQPNMFELEAF